MTLLSIAKKFGTPLYVYDEAVISERCRMLRQNFAGFEIFYAVKANNNPYLLAQIRKAGLGIECVSPGEIRAGKRAGFPKSKISYTCSNQTLADLKFAAKNAGYVHIDSLTQLELWGKHKLGKDVSLRLNEGIGTGHHRHVVTGGPDSKFGISEKDIPAARRLAVRYKLRITGLEQHIGSNILDKDREIYLRSVRKLLQSARVFPEVRHVDFGGGFGIPYRPGDKPLNLKILGREVGRLTKEFACERGGKVTFAIEPGRYVVAESGTLLATVVDMKSTSKHSFVGIDSGFNHLVRPAMYGSYQPIWNVSRPKGRLKAVTVGGNVCESGDLFAVRRQIAIPRLGDVLAIGCAGAYGMSMASVYNLRELPKEVVIKKGKVVDISESLETRVRGSK